MLSVFIVRLLRFTMKFVVLLSGFHSLLKFTFIQLFLSLSLSFSFNRHLARSLILEINSIFSNENALLAISLLGIRWRA